MHLNAGKTMINSTNLIYLLRSNEGSVSEQLGSSDRGTGEKEDWLCIKANIKFMWVNVFFQVIKIFSIKLLYVQLVN